MCANMASNSISISARNWLTARSTTVLTLVGATYTFPIALQRSKDRETPQHGEKWVRTITSHWLLNSSPTNCTILKALPNSLSEFLDRKFGRQALPYFLARLAPYALREAPLYECPQRLVAPQ